MENLGQIILLFDFYGGLLTPKQRQAFELHYGQDWSLAEIAEELGVSRPGALDLIQRARRSLERLEDGIGAIKRYHEDRAVIASALDLLKKGDPEGARQAAEKLEAWLESGGEDLV